jgi:hypothetical protein
MLKSNNHLLDWITFWEYSQDQIRLLVIAFFADAVETLNIPV